MAQLILKNGQGLIKQADSYFKKLKGSFRLTKQILENVPDDIVMFTSRIDDVIVSLDKIENIIKKNNISNQYLTNKLTKTSSKDINVFFNSLLKIIVSDNLSRSIYQEKGFITTIRTFLSLTNNMLIDLNSEISDVVEKLANSDTKLSDINFSTMIYFNIYSITPLIIYIAESLFTLISVILSDDNVDDYNHIAIILNKFDKHLSLIWKIVFTNKHNPINKSIKNNIEKKGINYSIFKKISNFFDLVKVTHIPDNLLRIFRLSTASKGFMTGDLYLAFKAYRLAKLNDKRNYMDMRILYLKSKLSNEKLNDEELKQIKASIEYYENKIQKLDKKINDIYL